MISARRLPARTGISEIAQPWDEPGAAAPRLLLRQPFCPDEDADGPCTLRAGHVGRHAFALNIQPTHDTPLWRLPIDVCSDDIEAYEPELLAALDAETGGAGELLPLVTTNEAVLLTLLLADIGSWRRQGREHLSDRLSERLHAAWGRRRWRLVQVVAQKFETL